jgi:hypothetical protein
MSSSFFGISRNEQVGERQSSKGGRNNVELIFLKKIKIKRRKRNLPKL